MPKRGRPPLTDEQAAKMAAQVVDLAFRLRYRPAGLNAAGHTRETASSVVLGTRYQGRVGAFIGDSISALFPVHNRTAVAVGLVLDHGLTIYRAAKLSKVDARNLKRALKAGREERAERALRIDALKTDVSTVNAPIGQFSSSEHP